MWRTFFGPDKAVSVSSTPSIWFVTNPVTTDDDLSVWVLDLDGVVWIGDDPIPGAAEAVEQLRSAGTSVWFVTNMSALRRSEMESKLERHGMPAEGRVVTSAMAAASLVEPDERVLVVGGPGIHEAVIERGATVTEDPAEASAVLAGMDPGFNYETLSSAMLAVRGGARLIGTNHDPSYPTPEGLRPGGGVMVEAIAASAEVRPVYAGKPQPPVADLVRELAGANGVMVGDRPDSDGLFAQALGYRFGLVLSGVTSEADLPVEPAPWRVASDLSTLVAEVLSP